MATLEEIRGRLETIRRQLDEVCEAIDAIEQNGEGARPGTAAGWPPGIRFADKEPLRQAFAELMRKMGIEHVQPIGAEALQEMMLREGVKPEECIGSRGIIEMREE